MINLNKNINIFALTDSHQEARKLCALFSLIEQNTYERGKNTLICDCGDLFKGIYDRKICVESYLRLRKSLPEAKIVMALGNNDFGFNLESLQYLQNTASVFNQANIHVLCANLYEEETNKRPKWVDPYILLDIAGKKIMVTAFCINYIKLQKYKLRLDDTEQSFIALSDTIKHIAPDLLIILNHNLYYNSLKLADLAEKSGIRTDLIIGGHEHSPVEANAEKHIYYPLAFNKNMLKFSCEFKENKPQISFQQEFLSKGIVPNSSYLPLLEKYEQESGLNIEVARSTINLEKRYSDPCSLGTFIADLMKQTANTDIGIISTGYTSHALRFEKDKILTYYNLERALSAEVVLQTMVLHSSDLRDIFNNALRNRYIQKSGNTRFLQCSQNITIVCAKNADNWGTVRQIYINGNKLLDDNAEPLDKDETFTCALDPYVASGELGFDALRKLPKETVMHNNQLVRIKDLFFRAIKDAPNKYPEGYEYPKFKLIDESL